MYPISNVLILNFVCEYKISRKNASPNFLSTDSVNKSSLCTWPQIIQSELFTGDLDGSFHFSRSGMHHGICNLPNRYKQGFSSEWLSNGGVSDCNLCQTNCENGQSASDDVNTRYIFCLRRLYNNLPNCRTCMRLSTDETSNSEWKLYIKSSTRVWKEIFIEETFCFSI